MWSVHFNSLSVLVVLSSAVASPLSRLDLLGIYGLDLFLSWDKYLSVLVHLLLQVAVLYIEIWLVNSLFSVRK